MTKKLTLLLIEEFHSLMFIGENELKENKVKIKCMANGEEIMVEREKVVEEIKKLLAILNCYPLSLQRAKRIRKKKKERKKIRNR